MAKGLSGELMTKHEFKAPFMAMCEIKDRTMSNVGMDLYYETVKHLDVETWNRAVSGVIANNKYAGIPQPAEILEATGQNEDKDAQAMLAMEKIKEAIRDHGPYQSVVFDDPIIHMLVSSHDKGWPGLCDMTLEEHKWLWKDWIKLYKAYQIRPKRYPARLIGLVEGQDVPLLDWQKEQMVSYVGDKAKCLEIEGEETLQIGGE
jgi:hypothetical protein